MFFARPLSPWKAVLLGIAAALAIFAFDLTQPLGVSGAAPFATLPLLGLLAREPRVVISLAILSSILTVAGMLLSHPTAPLHVVLLNRGMCIVLICVTAIIAVRHLEVGNALRESLENQAARDPLTELFNRRHVFAIVEDELRRYRRYGELCSLILIDADHFKRVNDEYGHGAGDLALRRIADVCQSAVRDSDVVGRFGGEEFIIVLPHTDTTAAAVVAERIRATMDNQAILSQDRAINVTLSLGVAEVGPDADTFDSLLKAADQALYAAKDAGRNRVAFAGRNAIPHRNSQIAA
jgi:diguanylate cyclase (GGDEF)-like protein